MVKSCGCYSSLWQRVGSLSRRTSKSSEAAIKVPIPGDATFISYKTSLQDYCQKVGWLPPVYSTNQFDDVYHSKVTFGGSTFDSGSDFGPSRQDAEQRAAHASLIGLGCLDANNKYSNDVSIAVPTAGDASFISYKCSLHDFCQQCNILPPRFSTSGNNAGFSSSVQVGSHTFNMSSRALRSTEAEQKVAFIALQGLCMMDSQAGYFPEACFTVPGPGDASFISFKSSLHDFCQKYKLPPPQYITNQGSHGYSAKLKFGGLFFQSSSHFTSRIEAEQHAAFEALQGLGLLESSVEFDSTLTNGGMHVGAGGATTGVVVGGLNSSRATSKGNSRSSSRPPSRPNSRPASRQGSLTQLNVSDNYNINTSLDLRDTSYNSLDSRSYNTGSGYDANSLNRSDQYHGNHSVSYHGGSARNGSVSGGQSASSTLSRQGQNSTSGTGSVSVVIKTSNQPKPASGYAQDEDVYAFSYSNYTGSGAVPKSRSKSVDQNYDDLGGGYDGSNSTSQNMMEYEHHSRASSGYATMPRKQIITNASNGSSSYVQYSTNHSSYSTSSTNRSYSSSNTMNRSHGYSGGTEVRGSASQPAIPDLEKEMAGLEGLIKDLNGITNSGKAS